MNQPKIYKMSFAKVYLCYIAKAEKNGRTKQEVNQIIYWLTGYTQKDFQAQLTKDADCQTFFTKAPSLNPKRNLIKGTICGVKVENIQEDTMKEIRYLDKLIDELARGKSMDKILGM